MLVADVLEVDWTAVLDWRGDSFIILGKVEPELKIAAFSALHYQVTISVVEIIERIQVVHLIDESWPEVLYT